MGPFLDSPEKIRQRQKNPPRKAYCKKTKLEKDKNKGMIDMYFLIPPKEAVSRIVEDTVDSIAYPTNKEKVLNFLAMRLRHYGLQDKAVDSYIRQLAKTAGETLWPGETKEFKTEAEKHIDDLIKDHPLEMVRQELLSENNKTFFRKFGRSLGFLEKQIVKYIAKKFAVDYVAKRFAADYVAKGFAVECMGKGVGVNMGRNLYRMLTLSGNLVSNFID